MSRRTYNRESRESRENRENANNSNSNNLNSNNRNNDTNNINNFSLSYDQRTLINMYQGFYDNINHQIDELYRAQDEIREALNYIIRNYNSNTNSNSTTNENNQRVYIDGRPYILEFQHQYIPNRRWQNTDLSYNDLSYNDLSYNDSSYNNIYNNLFNTNAFTQFSGLDILQNFYSSIPITPSRQQLMDGTRVCSFSQITEPINTSCPISLDIFEENSNVTQLRGCGHIFSSNSINYWFNNHTRCPVCRYDIRDYVPIQSTPPTNSNASENIINNEAQNERRGFSSNNLGSQNNNQERNSNSNNAFRSLSGLLVGQLLRSFTGNNVNINNPRYSYDLSNNEILLEAFLDNVE